MTQNSRILMAAVGAAALLAAGPAGADDRPEGWQGTWKPARGEVQRRDFKDKKAVKSLRAVWDRLGDKGYHGFHDVRRGNGWISCLAWKDGELYRIRVDSETGSVIGTRRVQ